MDDSGTHDPAGSLFSLRKSAHDLRNALNVIRNANYLLRRKLTAAGSENIDLADMIEDSVKTAEDIAADLMNEALRRGEPPVSRGGPANGPAGEPGGQ
jgi:signal transduction histidine kinase